MEAGLSRTKVARYESGAYQAATIVQMCQLLAAAGLGLRVSTYPLGHGVRDARHARGLSGVLQHAAPPLAWRTEVPLPNAGDARAWDALLTGAGRRTGVEYERVLHDTQAQGRRLALKRRDGGVDYLLVIFADTRANRAALRDQPTFMADLPRLPLQQAVAALWAGRHPGDALVLA